MIKKLKRRFLLIAMLSVIAVLSLLMGAINLRSYFHVRTEADFILDLLAENNGQFPGFPHDRQYGPPSGEMSGFPGAFPAEENGLSSGSEEAASFAEDGSSQSQGDASFSEEDASQGNASFSEDGSSQSQGNASFSEDASGKSFNSKQENGGRGRHFGLLQGNDWITEETPFETRFFSVTLGEDGSVTTTDTGFIAAVDEETANSYAAEAWSSGKERGFVGPYRYLVKDTDSGSLVIFVDCSRSLASFYDFLRTSILVSLIGCALVFLLLLFLSSVILKPAAESYAKQKRFITDASHELKTPLTVIDANTEVLEMVNGENEWSESIHRQVARLRSMTEKLVAMARMDEENRTIVMTDFSLTDAVEETVSGFETAAETRSLSLDVKADPNLTLHGEESSIRNLVSILMDNAMKYADPGSAVVVRLSRKGSHAELSVTNRCEGMEKGNHERLFDRFARADLSRNSEVGGFGIGLSMAQAIVLEHRGKISAESPENGVFKVTAVL